MGKKLRKQQQESMLGVKYYCKHRKWEWIKYSLLVGTVKNYALTACVQWCNLAQPFLLHTSAIYVVHEAKIWCHMAREIPTPNFSCACDA